MAATLFGNHSVTLTAEVPPTLRGTPVLFVEALALRNPRGARVYVEVYVEGPDGREHELGTFTFFGAPRDTDRQVFAFELAPEQREALAHSGVVRAAMKPFEASNGDVSDVSANVRAWISER